MDPCGLVAEAIVNIDNEVVANIGIDLRAGPLSVDADHRPRITIRCSNDPRYIPIQVHVFAHSLLHQPVQAERQESSDHFRYYEDNIHEKRTKTDRANAGERSRISMYESPLELINERQKLVQPRRNRQSDLGDMEEYLARLAVSASSPNKHILHDRKASLQMSRPDQSRAFRRPFGRNHSIKDIECEHATVLASRDTDSQVGSRPKRTARESGPLGCRFLPGSGMRDSR